MSVLDNILNDLNANLALQQIFGSPVSAALVVVWDGGDMRIQEAGLVPLSPEQTRTFTSILDQIISKRGRQ